MEKHIGIVLPPDLKAEIVDFGKRYGFDITEPHITLIPHEMLAGAKSVDRSLQSFCLSQPPFRTVIGGPNIENRDDRQIFYLTIMMGPINATRNKLIRHLKLPPQNGMFRPSVSLAEQESGGLYDFDEMLAEAKTLFSKPQSIDADALGIYTRSGKDAPFTMSTLYPFTGRQPA